MLLGQHEHHRVVSVTAARMNLSARRALFIWRLFSADDGIAAPNHPRVPSLWLGDQVVRHCIFYTAAVYPGTVTKCCGERTKTYDNSSGKKYRFDCPDTACRGGGLFAPRPGENPRCVRNGTAVAVDCVFTGQSVRHETFRIVWMWVFPPQRSANTRDSSQLACFSKNRSIR